MGSAVSAGEMIQKIASPDTASFSLSESKIYDVISWDPRGVGNTLPHLECFPDGSARDVFDWQIQAEGFDLTSTSGFSR